MHHHTDHAAGNGLPDVWTLLSPGVILFTLVIAAGYLFLTGSGSRYFTGAERVPMQKKVVFLLGLVIYYAAKGPIAAYGHLLFSAHMTEMALEYLLVPPLLLYGLPSWFLRPLLPKLHGLRFFTHPLITLLIFNGLFSVYHIPLVFDAIMASHLWMTVSHVLLTIASCLMWWPIVCPVPEADRLSYLQKMAYIFADGVLLTPACALIAFADTLMFDTFAQAPQIFAFLDPLDDQQLGAVIMKIVQEVAYGSVLGYTFFQWVRKQREEDKKEQEEFLRTAEHSQ
ncbi:cytochrome c oxidase assembly factor CtaG [Marinithermofilum abyssi]|uniref:Cytochrome c oxidase assembly factor CtaG n=1 Tax=Marinithermofilum abyssi TaxID=1571185 RepID=A0A8J2YEU4_9BACL|nr:cytochrome c oxidase assembly protein [Marinithermofilum abyssi]GGE26868.1 cytochrome c oxidase assembly factor CtaG [Marinithermofilum abyssi]